MKLPVMLEASGIKNIIIDGKIHWMRMNVDNSEWTRQLDNGRGYAYKSEEKLLKYVRHLIEHEGYDKVWVSGATINVTKVVTALVTRPEKVSPARIPGPETPSSAISPKLEIRVGDKVRLKSTSSANYCLTGIVEQVNEYGVIIKCDGSGAVRRLTMEYFREQYMWIEHKGI